MKNEHMNKEKKSYQFPQIIVIFLLSPPPLFFNNLKQKKEIVR